MSLDARAFRDALGAFATGVCVVSAQGPDGPFGVTINSFASVSLVPPLVLFSLDRGSDTLDLFTKSEGFTISVMQGVHRALTMRLARKGDHALDAASIASEGPYGARIADAHSWFVCEHHTTVDGGDHVIFLGRVVEFGVETKVTEPLLYYRGRFRALAASEDQ
ncbi:MAG: flavin reductase [Alphaproteobacteria bacterium]|nr:flavin reductase [Alphaproteobacteria bacterium]